MVGQFKLCVIRLSLSIIMVIKKLIEIYTISKFLKQQVYD